MSLALTDSIQQPAVAAEQPSTPSSLSPLGTGHFATGCTGALTLPLMSYSGDTEQDSAAGPISGVELGTPNALLLCRCHDDAVGDAIVTHITVWHFQSLLLICRRSC